MAESPESRLPQDPEYWEDLARRIRADAAAPLAAYAAARDAWYAVLARQAPWLVAASAAAMLVLSLALSARGSTATSSWMERVLAPDEIAGALVGGPEPPAVGVLMTQFPRGAGDGVEDSRLDDRGFDDERQR